MLRPRPALVTLILSAAAALGYVSYRALIGGATAPAPSDARVDSTTEPAAANSELAERLPDFALENLAGEQQSIASWPGKPLLINFWATWCAPCREEMPAMERLHQRYRQRGLVLLAVSVDTDASLVGPFLERYKLTFPVTLDAKMSLANRYGVRALPASFLIDRDGYLAALALGPRAWDTRPAHALVEGMLAP
jgi:peroxiredoxin